MPYQYFDRLPDDAKERYNNKNSKIRPSISPIIGL